MMAGCYLVRPCDRPRRGCNFAIVAAMATPLVPVKALDEAKRRLAPALAPIERRLLVIAILEDVLAALAGTTGLDRPVVVSPDREVWRRADALGCRVVEEPGPDPGGLNASLAHCADRTDAA